MLEKLIVKNVALIERAEIEFEEGLNVLSGETGSGKSVLLDSINFVLGAKADKTMIRFGDSECSVTAVFRPQETNPVFDVLKDMDIDCDESVLIARKFRQDGRGDIKVNGCSVNSAMLRKITQYLVDVHGQSEHFYLLSEANQLRLLDKAAGEPLQCLKKQLGSFLEKQKEYKENLKSLGGDEAERGRRLDILQYQLDEIERAQLKEGEEETLLAKKMLYANMEKILRSLSDAAESLNGENAGIDCLNSAVHSLSDIGEYDEEYRSLQERLDSVATEAEDIAYSLNSCLESLNFDEADREETESRLDLIRSLKKKYGNSIEQIFTYRDRIEEEFQLLSHCDEEFAKLSALLNKNTVSIYSVCQKMTELRKKAGKDFCERVTKELKTLNIPAAQFCAEFDAYGEADVLKANSDGMDTMRFLFSANAGEPLKPLNKVISGGEMSRLMLAIKTRISDTNDISTYIFDEIDTGISGATAMTVAEKFADIARQKQILAVTHLPQIAAMADSNYRLFKKQTQDDKTLTEIEALDAAGKQKEIIRLLGGGDSAAAQSLSLELIKKCSEIKRKLL